MTIFNLIYDVCNKKTLTLCDDIHFGDVNLSPYMLQRWLSMTSQANAILIDHTTNTKGFCDMDDKLAYLYYSSVVERASNKFSYVKKTVVKEDKKKTDEKEVVEHDFTNREQELYDEVLSFLNS